MIKRVVVVWSTYGLYTLIENIIVWCLCLLCKRVVSPPWWYTLVLWVKELFSHLDWHTLITYFLAHKINPSTINMTPIYCFFKIIVKPLIWTDMIWYWSVNDTPMVSYLSGLISMLHYLSVLSCKKIHGICMDHKLRSSLCVECHHYLIFYGLLFLGPLLQ